ncbi:nitroreductase family protein [Akkermansiaceae bacterium]|nr:nitroreductase family protein [Akkermansiaceae bacterium]
MRKLLKLLLGKSLVEKCRLHAKSRDEAQKLHDTYAHDLDLFRRFASPHRDFKQVESRLAFVVMLYHSLEKGLALKNPRPGFGREKAEMLIDQLEYLDQVERKDSRYFSGLMVIQRWLEWNQQHGKDFPDLAARVDDIDLTAAAEDTQWRIGGVSTIRREDIVDAIQQGPTSFMGSRHSIRQFSDEPVDIELIKEAIHLAQTSPSLCNRQSAHVYVISRGELMTKAMECQGGNRGFGEQVDKLLVITSELGCFLSVGERNQCWVEGGLFAMALILGLHSKGLGTCCLNWAKEPTEDREIHDLVGIPDDQRVVMMIAVGSLPEEFRITHSPRRRLDEIMHRRI